MKTRSALTLAGACLAFAGSSVAQGTECSLATPVTGEGYWSWTGAAPYHATNFSTGDACDWGGFYLDAFFEWTVDQAGDYLIDTTGATWNTVLAVYGGDCQAPVCIASDDSLGFYSQVTLTGLQVGETYLIRSSIAPESHPGIGALAIAYLDGVCESTPDDDLEPNNQRAQPMPIGNGTYVDRFVSNYAPDYYSVCIAPGTTFRADVLFAHAEGNVQAQLLRVNPNDPDAYAGTFDTSWSSTDNEDLQYTNTSAVGVSAVIRIDLSAATGAVRCQHYDLVISGEGGCPRTVTSFCDPMDPNSTGLPTVLAATALPGQGAELHLEATQGPPSQFAYLLVGTQATEPGLALGQGRFCLAITGGERYGRYSLVGTNMNSIGRFDPFGVLQNISGTSASGSGYDLPLQLPMQDTAGHGLQIFAGQTWHFQLWHRENAGQSNFSNGLSVAF